MSTSLARQLALLRTPAAIKSSLSSSGSAAVYSGPFIIPEAETDHSSVASLKGCVAESVSALCELEPDLMRFSVLLEMEEEEPGAKNLVKECLTLLCPHILNKHAQWLLQWLIIKHKVHINSPDWLVFNLLPYYSYQIYQSVLQHIDPTIRHANLDCVWLPQFKQSCVPTSQPGLQRHTATSQAFFRYLCEASLELGKHVATYPSIKLHKHTTFLMSTLLGALENIKTVSDQQVILLLQVILAGLKSSNRDMAGLASILLGYILPKVSLKPKVIQKICKSLGKYSKVHQSGATLNLLLLVSRTQETDPDTILELVVSHHPSINEMIIKAESSDRDNDTIDQIDALMYALATVLENSLPSEGTFKVGFSSNELQLVEIIASLTSVVGDIQAETAEYLVGIIADLLKLMDDEKSEETQKTIKKLNKILEVLGTTFPEVYRKIMIEKRDNCEDIFFLPSVDSPSENQLRAAKVLSSNQLVSVLSNNVLVEITPGKGAKKILKNNLDSLTTVLSCSTTFLQTQLTGIKLEILLINLLRVADSQEIGELTELVLKHLCNVEMTPIATKQSTTELLLLSVMLTSPSSREVILCSEFCKTSSLLSLISSLSPTAEDFISSLLEKLSVLLQSCHINTIINTKCLLHNTVLVTAILDISPKLVTRCGDELTRLLCAVVRSLRTEKVIVGEQDMFREARKMNIVPWSTLLKSVSGLVDSKTSMDNCELLFSSLADLIEKGEAENGLELANLIINTPHTHPLQFLLKQAHSGDRLKVACFSLSLAASYCKENVDQVRNSLKSKTDSSLLYLLSALMSDNSKVQRGAMKVLTKLDLSSSGQMKTVLQFFLEHKEEINNNVENIEKVLEREFLDAKSCREILSRTTAMENIDVFVRISSLFHRLSSQSELETLYKFGVTCVEKAEDPKYCSATIDIITKFIPIHVKSFDQRPLLEFFSACLSSRIVTTVAGLRKHIPQVLLSTLSEDDNVSQLPVNLHEKFLSQLSTNSSSEFYVEAKNFICCLGPSPWTFVGELNDIWGADTFSGKRTSGRGKFSLLYGGEASADDAIRWTRTSWMLEVLEKMLSNSEESSKDWLLMLRPLFVLLRKVTLMELDETSYMMTMLLNVMKHLLTRISDQDLQKIDQSQVDPELLVHCIKTSPNPDTRQTALQVLARCVIFNPDFILQNSITIFTFMGSHLLRVDSRNSFQVALQSLDILVPAIKAACESGKAAKLQSACMGVLTTFIDASLDIPAHRLTQFMERLIRCLGDREYLWAAALLLVKKDKANGDKKVVELFTKMEPENGLEALIRLLVNTRGDNSQLRKMFGVKTDRKDDESAKEKPDDWDLLRLRAVQTFNSVLSCSRFKSSVTSSLGNEDMDQLVTLLLEAAILTLNTFSGLQVAMPGKFRKNLLLQTEKALEQSLSVLPATVFISQCAVLLESEEASVRHRALEVVSSKLSSTTGTAPLPVSQLSALVTPLVKLSLTETQPHTQQLALLAVRQLSKLLPDTDSLQLAADSFTTVYLAEITNAKVLGAAVLSLGDILTCLGPKVVSKVPGLVTWLIERLEMPSLGQEQSWSEKEIVVVFNSFLYCLQKLVESFIGFLNPLLVRLIIMTCKMTGDDSLARAKPLLSCLANTIPPHSVLAISSQLLDSVMDDSVESSLPGLVSFVADNCRRLERNQLSSVSKQFVEFYTKALAYRASDEADDDKVDDIEDAVISAFLSVALKLSLEDFTPVYLKLANSLLEGEDDQHVTLFNFTDKVAAKLKSLFSFGVDSCVDFVIAALKEERSEEVVTTCLKSLTTVLKFNKLENISSGKYESLVSSLLSSWLLESSEIVTCLVQLAISTPEDSSWKHLHFQILLQLRDERPAVRMSILSVLTKCVTDRTDTYLPVLPDAVPFIQEILEDDDTNVEAACRDFIQHMETVFGQSLESYFV